MKFEEASFSKRYPPILCNIVTIHAKATTISSWMENGQLIYQDVPVHRRGTAVGIILPDGAMFVGVALCAAGDNFNKAIGRQVALGRAVQAVYRETVPVSSTSNGSQFIRPIQPNGWIEYGTDPGCDQCEINPMPQIIEILRAEIQSAREESLSKVKYF